MRYMFIQNLYLLPNTHAKAKVELDGIEERFLSSFMGSFLQLLHFPLGVFCVGFDRRQLGGLFINPVGFKCPAP